MFRPLPEAALIRRVPFLPITAVLLILALAVSIVLVLGLEHERVVVRGLTEGKDLPAHFFQALWQSRQSLIAVTALLFLMSGIAASAVITFLHYASVRRTLEEVKGLARNILRSIPTGVLTVNRAGLVTAVNPSAEAVLRRSSETVLGRPYREVFAEGDPIRTVLDRALAGETHVDHQDLAYVGDGSGRTIRVSTADLAGDEGDQAGVILLAKDVTDWLALERRVRSADKLAALHTLSAGVAHELRNPLSAVDLNLQLLEEELRECGAAGPKAVEYLRVLNAESRRLSAILDNFMRFARPGAVQSRAVDVGAVVGHILSLLQYEAEEKGIRLEADLAPGLPAAQGDEAQIGQVLLNVIVNAFQALPHGGLCRVEGRARRGGARHWLELVVRDTGTGIPAEALPRLFEPFYTTKAGGSGLGLAIAYRIVEDHGGTIEVASEPGSGTSVTVRLPAAAGVGAREAVGR
jgi:PAS domain S-box-containing protein